MVDSFALISITTLGKVELVYALKKELKKTLWRGYNDTLTVSFDVSVAKYPNPQAYETVEGTGLETRVIKRRYLTEGRVLFLHYQEIDCGGRVLVSKLIFERTLPEWEFTLLLTPVAEPYYSRQ